MLRCQLLLMCRPCIISCCHWCFAANLLPYQRVCVQLFVRSVLSQVGALQSTRDRLTTDQTQPNRNRPPIQLYTTLAWWIQPICLLGRFQPNHHRGTHATFPSIGPICFRLTYNLRSRLVRRRRCFWAEDAEKSRRMGCGQRTFDGCAWLKKRENELRAARSEGRAAFRLNASRFCMTRSQTVASL